MSAYIYKLIKPSKSVWMKIQVDKDTTIVRNVYHMKFWYKPYAGMEEDKKLQKKLSKEEAQTKKLFEGVDVEYAITTYEAVSASPLLMVNSLDVGRWWHGRRSKEFMREILSITLQEQIASCSMMRALAMCGARLC